MNNFLELTHIQLAPDRSAGQVNITPNVFISIEVMESLAHS